MYVERELGTLGDDLAGWIVLILPSLENVDFGLWCWKGAEYSGLGFERWWGDSETSCEHETSTMAGDAS